MNIDLTDFDTQAAPMEAIAEIVKDCLEGFVAPHQAINYINAVCIEWRQ